MCAVNSSMVHRRDSLGTNIPHFGPARVWFVTASKAGIPIAARFFSSTLSALVTSITECGSFLSFRDAMSRESDVTSEHKSWGHIPVKLGLQVAGEVELAAKRNGEIEAGLAATEMTAQTHQVGVGDDIINGDSV